MNKLTKHTATAIYTAIFEMKAHCKNWAHTGLKHNLKRTLVIMGRREKRSSQNLDLMLNLSPPSQAYYEVREGVAGSMSSSEMTPLAAVSSLCISSSESRMQQLPVEVGSEAGMVVVVGCQRCMMYFMLSELDLKCPKCKSNSLLCFNK
ncbi:hypothetical protein QQ045_026403 [Rhodiola kirilowii]